MMAYMLYELPLATSFVIKASRNTLSAALVLIALTRITILKV